jgi:transposase
MAAPKNARTVRRYSKAFKLKAVALANLEGVKTQDVAEALVLHPFMLSRWKKEAREGKLVGSRSEALVLEPKLSGELRRLREVERKYRLLQAEHALLKKAIRFCSVQRSRSSRSSRPIVVNMASR